LTISNWFEVLQKNQDNKGMNHVMWDGKGFRVCGGILMKLRMTRELGKGI